MLPKLRQQLSREEWDELQPIIRRVYIVENRTFPETADILSRDHRFRPTKKQFSNKIAEWGFKKNANKRERRELLQSLEPVDGDTVIDKLGREHKRQKLERWGRELKSDPFGHPQPFPGSANSEGAEDSMSSDFPLEFNLSTDPTVSDPVVAMMPHTEVDDATPIVPPEGERRVWVQDPDEFKYFPFAKWANVDVQGSPKLTRLFANLTLETNELTDDIDSLFLPGPCVEPPTSRTPEFVTCTDLVAVSTCKGGNQPLSWQDEVSFSDTDTAVTLLPAQKRKRSIFKAFRHSDYDAWFPTGAQIWIAQYSSSPLNELYPFPTFPPGRSNRSQTSRTALQSSKMKELELENKLGYLERAGLDETHPVVFEVMHRLADELYYQGKNRPVEALLRKLCSVQEITGGPQHLDILSVKVDLVYTLQQQGKIAEAREIHEDTHEKIVKAFPPHHDLFRNSMVSRIKILDEEGRLDEAESISRQLIQLNLVHFGPKDPYTVDAMYRLARLMRTSGNYTESETLHRIELQLSHEANEREYDDICWSFNDLAQVFGDRGQLDEAVKYFRLAADIGREFLGDEHTTTMNCNSKVAEVLQRRGNLQESEELLFATAKLQMRALGEDHHHTLWTMYKLGRTLFEIERDHESALWLEKSFRGSINTFESWYSVAIASCDNLGVYYENQGRYDDALEVYQELLDAARTEDAIDDAVILEIQGWIDAVHGLMDEEQAKTHEEESDGSGTCTQLIEVDSDDASMESAGSVGYQD